MSQTSVGKNYWAELARGVKNKELQQFLLSGNKKYIDKKQAANGKNKKKFKVEDEE